jgi:tRNA(adenine34) deaminase
LRRTRPPHGAPDNASQTIASPLLQAGSLGRSARAAESARLEIVCGETHRGFKSHLLRPRGRRRAGWPARLPPALPSCPVPADEPFLDDASPHDDAAAMRVALEEGGRAEEHGDVPVGAVGIVDGAVVSRRHNERERRHDPTAHAELLVVRDAAAALGSWRLERLTVVVTLEPCAMCAGALVAARVGRLVFGAADPKAGACGSLYNLCADPRLNHELPVSGGVLAEECAALLSSFFAARR